MGVRGLVPTVCCHGSAPLARDALRSNFFFATPVEPALCNATRGAVTPTANFDFGFGFGFDLPAAWSKRVLLGTPVVADGVPRWGLLVTETDERERPNRVDAAARVLLQAPSEADERTDADLTVACCGKG